MTLSGYEIVTGSTSPRPSVNCLGIPLIRRTKQVMGMIKIHPLTPPMNLTGLDSVVAEGRKLLAISDDKKAHDGFHVWDATAAEWLDRVAPVSGLSAEWSALKGSRLFGSGTNHSGWYLRQEFEEVVKERLTWLSKLAAQ